MITFRVDDKIFQKDLERFRKKSARDFVAAIDKATMDMLKYAKLKVRNLTRNAKVRSSTLINNIIPQITDKGLTGAVLSKANYSEAFERGQRPHIIRVKTKKVLAGPKRGAPPGWDSFSGDYAVYGKKVRHPGTHPRPFMFPAWTVGKRVFENLLKKALS